MSDTETNVVATPEEGTFVVPSFPVSEEVVEPTTPVKEEPVKDPAPAEKERLSKQVSKAVKLQKEAEEKARKAEETLKSVKEQEQRYKNMAAAIKKGGAEALEALRSEGVSDEDIVQIFYKAAEERGKTPSEQETLKSELEGLKRQVKEAEVRAQLAEEAKLIQEFRVNIENYIKAPQIEVDGELVDTTFDGIETERELNPDFDPIQCVLQIMDYYYKLEGDEQADLSIDQATQLLDKFICEQHERSYNVYNKIQERKQARSPKKDITEEIISTKHVTDTKKSKTLTNKAASEVSTSKGLEGLDDDERKRLILQKYGD